MPTYQYFRGNWMGYLYRVDFNNNSEYFFHSAWKNTKSSPIKNPDRFSSLTEERARNLYPKAFGIS